MDPIDLHVEVTPVPLEELASREAGEGSRDIQQRVEAARQRQLDRFQDHPGLFANALMTSHLVRKLCPVD